MPQLPSAVVLLVEALRVGIEQGAEVEIPLLTPGSRGAARGFG
ncbi:MAG: hypothetical protein R6W06_09740 [Prochlorococcaceae cyanobacterium]